MPRESQGLKGKYADQGEELIKRTGSDRGSIRTKEFILLLGKSLNFQANRI